MTRIEATVTGAIVGPGINTKTVMMNVMNGMMMGKMIIKRREGMARVNRMTTMKKTIKMEEGCNPVMAVKMMKTMMKMIRTAEECNQVMVVKMRKIMMKTMMRIMMRMKMMWTRMEDYQSQGRSQGGQVTPFTSGIWWHEPATQTPARKSERSFIAR